MNKTANREGSTNMPVKFSRPETMLLDRACERVDVSRASFIREAALQRARKVMRMRPTKELILK